MFNSTLSKKLFLKLIVSLLILISSRSVFALNECADLIDKKEYYKALELCKKNANNGIVSAQFNLGTLYYQGLGVMADKHIAYKWILKAAKSNYPQAQYNIGIMTANGIGVTADLVKAYAWLTLAKKNGYEEASSVLKKMGEELSEKEKQQAEKVIQELTTNP